MKPIILTAALAALSACAHHINSEVTAYNGDSVTIATSETFKRRWALNVASDEAERVCRQGQGKRAEHASTRKDRARGRNLDLFLCLQ